MKFNRKVMAAMVMGLATASAVAGGHAGHGDKGPGRCGHEGGPSKALHGGGPAGLALFGIGPFGARPPMPHGPHGMPPAEAGKDAARADDARLTEEQRARRFEEHLERRIARTLNRVDGTQEQARKIAAVVSRALSEMRPLHEQLRALDEKAAGLFKAETIDRAAFGQLRTERLKLMDELSQRSMAAYLDALALLDAGQRQKLAEQRRERSERGAHRGRDGRGEQRPERGGRGERGQGQAAQPAVDAGAMAGQQTDRSGG